MADLREAPGWVLAFVMIGAFAVAGIIAVKQLGGTEVVQNDTDAQNVISQVVHGIGGITSMLTAIGVMIGVGILLWVLIRAFAPAQNSI